MTRGLLLLTLLMLSGTAFGQTDTGNLDVYLQKAIDDLPERGGKDFQKPANQQLQQWERAVELVLSGKIAKARKTADSFDYNLIRFTDTTLAKDKPFLLLKARKPVQNHWGIYVFNPDPCRDQLVIQCPHPKYDLNTGDQGVYCFKRLSANALFLSGTHRCNQNDTSACSGKTSVCNGSNAPYPTSDMAHNARTPFQRATAVINDKTFESVFLQFHGFGQDPGDPFLIMSNGTRQKPANDYLVQIQTELKQIDTALTYKIAHQDTSWNRLIGFTNVQGRLINGSNEPCSQGAVSGNGRFLHLEQEKSRLREDSAKWYKIYQALANVFTCSKPSTIQEPRHEDSSIKVFPNPTNGEIHLSTKQVEVLKLFDKNGQLVKKLSGNLKEKPMLNLHHLPPGIYFLQIELRDSLVTKKVVKLDKQ